jgi:hypothetical protein
MRVGKKGSPLTSLLPEPGANALIPHKGLRKINFRDRCKKGIGGSEIVKPM